MNKRNSYLLAAKSIAEGYNLFCCTALGCLGVSDEEFTNIFRPKNKASQGDWFGHYKDEKNQLARSLALLFMAEMDS